MNAGFGTHFQSYPSRTVPLDPLLTCFVTADLLFRRAILRVFRSKQCADRYVSETMTA